MKTRFWMGLSLLVVGVGSLFVSMPMAEIISRSLSIALIVGGIALTLAAGAK